MLRVALTRPPEEIRAEAARAAALVATVAKRAAQHRAGGDLARARRCDAQLVRIRAHLQAYDWLLGVTDVAPVTGRRVPAVTTRDLWLETAPGRDHAEQNSHSYDDPVRARPEAVFDAIAWARGEVSVPPSGE